MAKPKYNILIPTNTPKEMVVSLKMKGIWKSEEYRSKRKKPNSPNPTNFNDLEIKRNKCRLAILERYKNGWQPRAGRCKKITYISHVAGEVKLDGNWELKVAQYFDSNNINWERNAKRFKYLDSNGKERSYCPDFFLLDENKYIEVKGFVTELDKLKWNQFPYDLEIWNKDVLRILNIL